MAKTFKLDILAADKYFYSGECEEMTFPSMDGRRGVKAGHEGMICCLTAGALQGERRGTQGYRFGGLCGDNADLC